MCAHFCHLIISAVSSVIDTNAQYFKQLAKYMGKWGGKCSFRYVESLLICITMKRAGHDEIHENIAGTESGGKKGKFLHQGHRHG